MRMTPKAIIERIANIRRNFKRDLEPGYYLYRDVLIEISRRDCIDPRSLAIEALKLDDIQPPRRPTITENEGLL